MLESLHELLIYSVIRLTLEMVVTMIYFFFLQVTEQSHRKIKSISQAQLGGKAQTRT